MGTKFTKTNWEVSDQGENGLFILAKNPNDSDKDAICRIYNNKENAHQNQAMANAKLIASSRDLLDVLNECNRLLLMSNDYLNSPLYNDVKSAIKKATE